MSAGDVVGPIASVGFGGAVWPWVALFGLGALHGLNPGMGWLFAVGLGMQRGERRAVWRALLPLAVGHGLAIAVTVSIAAGLGLAASPMVVRWTVVAILFSLGVRQLRRHRHPRAGGMRVNDRQLALWSFLVASAHGAGIMAAPFALDAAGLGHMHGAHAAGGAIATASLASIEIPALVATAIHTAGYLLIAGLFAVVVYERAALHLLRRAWVNIDLIWAGTLFLTAIAIAFR